ncbi:hypothetical protein C8J57DRAFT_1651076 [Mycena rebaudengoi]|nr:hypothetical protein C8J57DRAFT_1651076 [Mycena rebaudengoi]
MILSKALCVLVLLLYTLYHHSYTRPSMLAPAMLSPADLSTSTSSFSTSPIMTLAASTPFAFISFPAPDIHRSTNVLAYADLNDALIVPVKFSAIMFPALESFQLKPSLSPSLPVSLFPVFLIIHASTVAAPGWIGDMVDGACAAAVHYFLYMYLSFCYDSGHWYY